ncbi:MAG: hypothetical protein JF887_10540 [Candidatus Dormibacteraeota bacterium]|uniref:Uncharacterized protein n=1 Tax=Candidatus Amunia macphersoniae TaxID=3127014 RepID=A0A934NFE9_9BACT|nr:hypothetical protein [Candidatus Dormibacteraeota bacterium]
MQRPAPTAAADDDEKRPVIILAVYSWDILLALLALLAALAAFGGQATVGTRTVNVGLGEQILAALSAASFAGLLIILATLLTRRQRWVRRAQIAALTTAIVLGAAGLLVAGLIPGQGLELVNALTSALLLLVDALVIVALTGQRVLAWYNASGSAMPKYISGTIAFWGLSSLVLIVLQAAR